MTFDRSGSADVALSLLCPGDPFPSSYTFTKIFVKSRQRPIGDTILCKSEGMGYYKYDNIYGANYSWVVENGTIQTTENYDSITVQWDKEKFPDGPFFVAVSHQGLNGDGCSDVSPRLEIKLVDDCTITKLDNLESTNTVSIVPIQIMETLK